MEGHPAKRLRGQKFEDIEQEFQSFDKPCVQVVDKRTDKPQPEKKDEQPREKIVLPIQERDVVQAMIPGRATLESESAQQQQAESSGKPKKKMSLFAQRLQQQKQSSQNQQQSNSGGFPQLFKVEEETKKQPKLAYNATREEQQKRVSSQVTPGSKVVQDDIGQENLNKIREMSKEEIQEELDSLKQSLSPALLSKLQKMGGKPISSQSNSGQQKGQTKQNMLIDKEAQNRKPIETNEISDIVTKAAKHDEQKLNILHQLTFNIEGQTNTQEPSQAEMSKKEDTINYLNHEEFLDLDKKFFSVMELQNLMSSSEIHQRLYSLRLLKSLVQSSYVEQHILFGVIMEPKTTQIVHRLVQILSTANRLDLQLGALEAVNSICRRLFDKTLSSIQQSELIYGHELWKTNIKMHNLCLEQTIDSYNNPELQVTVNDFGLLSMVFEEQNIEVLLRKAKSCLQILMTSSEYSGKDNQAIDSILELLLYLSHYNNNSALMTLEQFIKKTGKVLTLYLVELDKTQVIDQLMSVIKGIMLFSKENALTCYNDIVSDVFVRQHCQAKTFENLTSNVSQVTQYYQCLNAMATYDISKVKWVEDHLQVLLEIFKKAEDEQLLVAAINISIQISADKVLKKQLVRPCFKILQQRNHQSSIVQLKVDQLSLVLEEPTLGLDNLSVNLQLLSNLSSDRYLDTCAVIQRMTISRTCSNLGENLSLVATFTKGLNGCYLNNYHATLAYLSPFKEYLFVLLISEAVPLQNIPQCIQVLMKLLSMNDEYLLMTILNKYHFGPPIVSKEALNTADSQILTNFYLGYCQSDKQTYEESQVNYQVLRSGKMSVSGIKRAIKTKDFFLPLLDDWFMRPLLYIDKEQDSNLQSLCVCILKYVESMFANHRDQCLDLLRLTESQWVMLVCHMLTSPNLKFDAASTRQIDLFVDRLFFPKADATTTINKFCVSDQSEYLSFYYKEIFMTDAFRDTVINFFNEKSPDECPAMLKILIVALQPQSGENKGYSKALLSELTEQYLLLIKMQLEILPLDVPRETLANNYSIDKKDPDLDMFYLNFKERLDKQIERAADGEREAARLRSSLLYQIIDVSQS